MGPGLWMVIRQTGSIDLSECCGGRYEVSLYTSSYDCGDESQDQESAGAIRVVTAEYTWTEDDQELWVWVRVPKDSCPCCMNAKVYTRKYGNWWEGCMPCGGDFGKYYPSAGSGSRYWLIKPHPRIEPDVPGQAAGNEYAYEEGAPYGETEAVLKIPCWSGLTGCMEQDLNGVNWKFNRPFPGEPLARE